MKQPLTRAALPSRVVRVLNRGGFGNPDVLLVRHLDGSVVLKDHAPRSWLMRNTPGRMVTALEARAWRAVASHPNVPRFLARIDPLALLIEYRPGRKLSKRRIVPPGFLDEPERAIEGLHRRGVVRLDLSHRSNALIDAEGHPVLIAFGSSFVLRPGSLLWALSLALARPVRPSGPREVARQARGGEREGRGGRRDAHRPLLAKRPANALMSRPAVSVCVIAMNEEDRIAACLRSADFADEWIVVDSHSTDRTRDMAAECGARVVERDWPSHVEQKNFGRWIYHGAWYPDRKLRLARERHRVGRRSRLSAVILRPTWKFLKIYLAQGGSPDGRAGFFAAVTGAYYVFLKYAKHWEVERGERPQ
jgi:hypothetical protein